MLAYISGSVDEELLLREGCCGRLHKSGSKAKGVPSLRKSGGNPKPGTTT